MRFSKYIRLLGLLVVLLLVFVITSKLPWQEIKSIHQVETNNQVATTTPLVFQKPDLLAKASIVYDVRANKIIYGQSENETLPLASITKLMTAVTSSDVLTPNSVIKITGADLELGSNAGLEAGHSWDCKDLLDFMLTTSSNGAARAIARSASEKSGRNFIDQMNAKARTLGLISMQFYNESGLDQVNGLPGSRGSASDVAKLMTYIISSKPDMLESTRWNSIKKKTLDNSLTYGQNTNLIIKTIPGFIGSKTGFTELAGGNLAVAFDAGLNRPIVAVVLGSTEDGRFSDMQKLINETLKTLSNNL